MKKIIHKEINIDGINYMVEVGVTFHVDENYGEDADGNRGISRTFIDDFEIVNIMDEDSNFIQSDELKNMIIWCVEITSEDIYES